MSVVIKGIVEGGVGQQRQGLGKAGTADLPFAASPPEGRGPRAGPRRARCLCVCTMVSFASFNEKTCPDQ